MRETAPVKNEKNMQNENMQKTEKPLPPQRAPQPANNKKVSKPQPQSMKKPMQTAAKKPQPPDKKPICQNNQCTEKIHMAKKGKPFDISSLIHGIVPTTIYNPKTKKILGFLTAEDLLLVALIFLFSESDDDPDPLMILALVYILLSEYIDLPEI